MKHPTTIPPNFTYASPQERVAAALERIATALESATFALPPMTKDELAAFFKERYGIDGKEASS